MTATNHVITGAVIVLVVHNPVVALPLAFLSHFVLDALPHFGRAPRFTDQKSSLFPILLGADMVCALAVLAMIALIAPANWQMVMLGSVLAASPDLLWLPGYLQTLHGHRPKLGPVRKLLGAIQWGERPWGILVETAWFILATSIFIRLAVTHLT